MTDEVQHKSYAECKEETLLGTQRQLLRSSPSGRKHIFADFRPQNRIPLQLLPTRTRLNLTAPPPAPIPLLRHLLADLLRSRIVRFVVLGLHHLDFSDWSRRLLFGRPVLAVTLAPVVDVGVVEGSPRAAPVDLLLRPAGLLPLAAPRIPVGLTHFHSLWFPFRFRWPYLLHAMGDQILAFPQVLLRPLPITYRWLLSMPTIFARIFAALVRTVHLANLAGFPHH